MKVLCLSMLVLGLVAASARSQTADFVWVFLNTNPNRAELPKPVVDSLQREHIANIERLAAEGKLLAAGPFEGGGGMFVFRPTAIDSVKFWVSTDPAVKAGRFLLEFLPYHPIVGSICKVGEGYKMTNYTSVRFKADAAVDGVQLVRSALAMSTRADTIIAAGAFGTNGGFIVYKGRFDETRFHSLDAMKSGVAVVRKGLFIARGSFCEPS